MRAAGRSEFLPPAEPGLMRSVGLALLAHAVLVLALSWGLKWKREDQNVSVEAELWSSTVQQAAPKPQEAPPPPPPAPEPAPALQPPAPDPREADIALDRDRRRAAQEKARQEEAERERERQRQQAERRREDQARRQEQAKKAAEDRRREEQARARSQQQETERLARIREDALKRMQGLAGATGVREATGTAVRSAGPSATYAARLAALFQRNVVFPGGVDSIPGNPAALVQVRVSPTGSILSARLVRSSGNPGWDAAAVRAIERAERIPPDEEGRYLQEFPVNMRPKADR